MHKNGTLSLSCKLNDIINKIKLKNQFLQSNFYPSFNKSAGNQMIRKQNNIRMNNNDFLVYSFNKQSNLGYKLSNKIIHSKTILEHLFQNTFISTPKFKLSNKKIIITLFYYNLSENEISKFKTNQLNYSNKLEQNNLTNSDSNRLYSEEANAKNAESDRSNVDIANLEKAFVSLFNINVEIRFIKLYYPFLNSKILAKFITTVNSNKFTPNLAPIPKDKNIIKSSINKKLRMDRIDSIFRKINLIKSDLKASFACRNSHFNNSKFFINDKSIIKTDILNLIGVKYEIAGRMTRRRTASRSSLISKYKGTFKPGSKKSMIDYTKFSYKNKNGAFTVKVWLSANNPLI